MKFLSYGTGLLSIVLTLLAAVLLGQPAIARDNPSDHPIKVLKAKIDGQSRGFDRGGRGTLSIWLKNAAEVTVDGIVVSVDLYDNRRRKINTLTKEVEPLAGGEKTIVVVKWDEFEEVKPRFYIEYFSRGNQKTKFEGDTPSWN
ncbi:MAG: hypothetical protein WC314_18755 [Vulcanimicrobiota bacterium]